MAVKKSFQELEYKDSFLFALTMEDEEICRGVLERILEIPEDPLIRQIDMRITSLKQNRRMEVQYMLFGEMLDDERKEGFEEGYKCGEAHGEARGEARGREKAESSILTLITRMQEEGLGEEIPRLLKEPEFLREMYKRFQLDK